MRSRTARAAVGLSLVGRVRTVSLGGECRQRLASARALRDGGRGRFDRPGDAAEARYRSNASGGLRGGDQARGDVVACMIDRLCCGSATSVHARQAQGARFSHSDRLVLGQVVRSCRSRASIFSPRCLTVVNRVAEHQVRIGHARDGIAARLIIARKPPEAIERQHARLRRRASRNGQKTDPRTLRTAGFMMLLTSLPSERSERGRGGQAVPHALADRAGIQAAEEPRRLRRVARQRPQAGSIVAAGPPDRRGPDRGFAGRSARTVPLQSNASASNASGTAARPVSGAHGRPRTGV